MQINLQPSLKIFLILIILLYIFFILKAVKRKNMRIGYLVFWLITSIVLTIALITPNSVENISNFIGFEIPINMIFCIAIFIILYLIYDLTILITKEQNKSVALIQEISMLKEKIENLEKTINDIKIK